ncbi:hypothetical protein C8J57DRAFT_1232409 [Mycena rebaudengoi]|nr:hypothetical protein C8J57DRAFT_1245167 [Mycena rebaudengoi]KAJ7261550.1 hypothetical protein C8J57DRAFT_1232409 [Mycena rebaudengoi]
MLLDIPGTTFTSLSTNSLQMVKASIILNYSLLSTPDIHLGEAAAQLLELYPGIPSLGSPFSTGDDTFGLDSEFKRLAAISCESSGLKTFAYLFTDPAPPAFPPYLGGPNWPEYKDGLLQLHSANVAVIPDDYRAEQIDFISENLVLFRH